MDKNGMMTDNFEVGDFDPGIAEDWGSENTTEAVEEGRAVVKKFGWCKESMREYIPCLDNVQAIRGLESTERGERFERHCPEKGKGLDCLVPAPKGYKTPIPWPRSRDEVVLVVLICWLKVVFGFGREIRDETKWSFLGLEGMRIHLDW